MTAVNRTSIEFVVRPKEDLYLDGPLRRLPRVSKGEAYPCQMQKNQNFSCLFRHYAKHNGLRKEDLVFTFVEELLPDQTPETVHLMPQDEIFVEHRKCTHEDVDEMTHHQTYSNHFRNLLLSGIHSDITFLLNNDTEIHAHKAILAARSEYFDAMFRIGGMIESEKKQITIYQHDSKSFKRMLEFIYTNEVIDLNDCSSSEAISLLMMANEYVLQDLRTLCESRVMNAITIDNIGKLLLLSSGHNASLLKDACAAFVQEHKGELVANPTFRQEIENNAELGLLLFESCVPKSAVVNTISDDLGGGGGGGGVPGRSSSYIGKKRRRSSAQHESSSNSNDHDSDFGGINTSSNAGAGVATTTTTTNTIAPSNANVQDI